MQALPGGDSPFALATIAEDRVPGGVLAIGEDGSVVDGLAATAEGAEIAAAAWEALRAGRTALRSVESRHVFTEVLSPPPKLLVCGAGEASSVRWAWTSARMARSR